MADVLDEGRGKGRRKGKGDDDDDAKANANANANAKARGDGADADVPSGFEVGAALFASAAAATVAFLFRGTTLLPAGFFDAGAAAALGFGAAPLARRLLGPAAATLARGAGLAAAALLVSLALVAPFDAAALPLVAWVAGGALLQASTRAKTNGPVLAALGVTLLLLGGAATWTTAATWPEAARLRWTIAAAGALAATLLLARLWVARKAPRLAPSPAGILVGAVLAATYLGYRPLVAAQVANLPLYEWTLGVGVAVLFLGRLRRSARDNAVPEAWTGSARKHEMDAAPAYDARMPPLAAAITRYLESGQGFEDYRAAMLRAAPHAPPPFRKTLQGATPVPGKGRAGRAATAERLKVHRDLVATMERRHGDPTPPVRAHP